MKVQYLYLLSFFFFFVGCSSQLKENEAMGRFEATEVVVSSESMGQIIQFTIQEGNTYSQNETIGLIDTTQIHLQQQVLFHKIKALKSKMPDITLQVAALESKLVNLNLEHKRILALVKADAVPAKQLDDINSLLRITQDKIEAQKSQLSKNQSSLLSENKALEAQIMVLKDKINKCHLMIPFTGTILTKYKEAYEFAGMGQPLYKMANLNEVYLRAYVTSKQLASIQLNQPLKVTASYGGKESKEYQGRVSWIASKNEFTPKSIQTNNERQNLIYPIKVAVKNDGYIKIGMYGTIEL